MQICGKEKTQNLGFVSVCALKNILSIGVGSFLKDGKEPEIGVLKNVAKAEKLGFCCQVRESKFWRV